MDYMTGINTSYADTYDKTSSDLTDKINGTDFSKASDDELMSVCKDFESYFVEQVLKSMEKMAKIDSDDEDSNLFSSMAGIGGTEDTSLNTLGSYFGDEMVSSYAKLMTDSNHGKGLGIAQTLYEQMKRNYSTESIPKADEQE